MAKNNSVLQNVGPTSGAREYDFVIVGAGPAGYGFAEAMSRINPELRIAIFEKGKNIRRRFCPVKENPKVKSCLKCPVCGIMNGSFGAGGRSDGKVHANGINPDIVRVGGNLPEHIGVLAYRKLVQYVMDKFFKGFYPELTITGQSKDEVQKMHEQAMACGLQYEHHPIGHIGTDGAEVLIQRLEDELITRGVELNFSMDVKDILLEDGKVKGILVKNLENNEYFKVFAPKVVMAVGRSGANWMQAIAKKYGIQTENGRLDIGLRVESTDEVFYELNKHYEVKLYLKTPAGEVRSFCTNPSGHVVNEGYPLYINGVKTAITLANGHAYEDPEKQSKNTNEAVLVSIQLPKGTDPYEYTKEISMKLGPQLVVQRLGDLRNHIMTTREGLDNNSVNGTLQTGVPGNLWEAIPAEILEAIIAFLDAKDKLAPGLAGDDTLLYGLEAKFCSVKIGVDEDFQTSISGLYAIGDGSGMTRSLMQASVQGTILAMRLAGVYEEMLEEIELRAVEF